jgi:sugar/nucleoside kinase (ribokinase family)
MKILGLGNALVDVLVQLDNDDIIQNLHFPKGSMQLIGLSEIPKITEQINNLPAVLVSGGSAANTIHGLASLGASCGYIGKVGKDELGQFYAKDLQDARVEDILYQSSTETGRAYTMISPDSERTFATYLGAAIELQASEINPSLLKNYQVLHIEGYLVQNTSLIEKSLILAKEAGLTTSLDLASYNVVESNLDFLSELIPKYVDIVFANEEEAKAYTKSEPENALKLLASQSKIAIVKIGKSGSLIQSGDTFTRIQIEPVQSVDSTGAGDQYAAGFLYGFINKLSMEKCGRLGSLLAGTVVKSYGARIQSNLWPDILKKTELIMNA